MTLFFLPLFVLFTTGEPVVEERSQDEHPKRYPIVLEMDTKPIVIHYGDMFSTKEVFLVNKGDRKLDMPKSCRRLEFSFVNDPDAFSLEYYPHSTVEFEGEVMTFRLGENSPDDEIPTKSFTDGMLTFLPSPGIRFLPGGKIRSGSKSLYCLPLLGTEVHPFWQALENCDPEQGMQCFLKFRFSMKRCLEDSRRIMMDRNQNFMPIPEDQWPPEDPEAIRLHELLEEGYTFEDELVVRCPVTILPRAPEERTLIRSWIQSGPLLAEPYPRNASNWYFSPFPWLESCFQHPFYMESSPLLPTAGPIRTDYDPRFSNVRDPEKFIQSGENFLERSKTLEQTQENLKRIEEAKVLLPQAREYFAIKERYRQREEKSGEYAAFCEMLATRTPEALRRIEEGRELGRKLLAMNERGELPLSPTFREFIVFREKLVDFRFAATPEERVSRFDHLLDWLTDAKSGKFWQVAMQGTLNGMKSMNRTAESDKSPPVFEEDIDAYSEKLKERFSEQDKATQPAAFRRLVDFSLHKPPDFGAGRVLLWHYSIVRSNSRDARQIFGRYTVKTCTGRDALRAIADICDDLRNFGVLPCDVK